MTAQHIRPDTPGLRSDFVLGRGHPFGSHLPDTDKRALIEYLKTF